MGVITLKVRTTEAKELKNSPSVLICIKKHTDLVSNPQGSENIEISYNKGSYILGSALLCDKDYWLPLDLVLENEELKISLDLNLLSKEINTTLLLKDFVDMKNKGEEPVFVETFFQFKISNEPIF